MEDVEILRKLRQVQGSGYSGGTLVGGKMVERDGVAYSDKKSGRKLNSWQKYVATNRTKGGPSLSDLAKNYRAQTGAPEPTPHERELARKRKELKAKINYDAKVLLAKEKMELRQKVKK
jgi:hypothetical protein